MTSDDELEFRQRLFAFIRQQRDVIHGLRDPKMSPAIRKALWCTLLDTLARGRYPAEREHRKRFTNFVRHCCDWKEADKISLPYLFQFAKVPPNDRDSGLDDVRKVTLQIIQHWRTAEGIPLSRDLQWPDVERILPPAYRRDVKRDFSAYGLLYAQRNGYVHEFRGKGASWSFEAKEPEYTILHDDGEEVSLEWPDEFFVRMVSAGAANLEFWAHETNASLLTSFGFGVFAYDYLNVIPFDRRR